MMISEINDKSFPWPTLYAHIFPSQTVCKANCCCSAVLLKHKAPFRYYIHDAVTMNMGQTVNTESSWCMQLIDIYSERHSVCVFQLCCLFPLHEGLHMAHRLFKETCKNIALSLKCSSDLLSLIIQEKLSVPPKDISIMSKQLWGFGTQWDTLFAKVRI